MLATEKKLSGRVDKSRWAGSWPWIGLVALSGLALSAPVVVGRWRRRSYRRQEDWMDAYVRGCLGRNRRSS